jgi:hypothetical protein
MEKNPKTIAEEIIKLVSELVSLAGADLGDSEPQFKKSSAPEKKSGATGGIRLLAEEGKLNPPKELSEIMSLLKQEGRHYSKPAVAMGLINLFRERVLTRVKDSGNKNWKYAVRK